MQITLIHPPTLLNLGTVGTAKPTLPIGLAYIAAAARAAGHTVRVVDAIAMAPYETWRDGELSRVGADVAAIVAAVPDDTEVIGIGCMFSFIWPGVRELVHALRARFPAATIIAGGEHLTALPVRSLAEAPIDYAVLGEGEETFVELLDVLGRGGDPAGVAGIAFRRDGTVHQTPRRARIRAIDDIAWPAWDLFQPDVYNAHRFSLGIRLGYSMPILATRGCPYRCTYCTSPQMWTTRWVARDPVRLVDEIEAYHQRYGATSFLFHDLTAVIRRDWMTAFCEELLRRGLAVSWQLPAGTRCEAFDQPLAALMVRAGCRYLCFAPESGSDELRTRVQKRLDRDVLLNAVRAAVAAGMHVTCFLMIGVPDETTASLRDTERLARTLAREGIEDISCHYFYPAPGSQLYHELAAQGRLTGDDTELMAPLLISNLLLPPERCYTTHVSHRELSRWRLRIFASFYGTRYFTRPRALLQLAANIARDRETNKLEAFAREMRIRLRLRFGAARSAA